MKEYSYEDLLCEMADLLPSQTNLPCVVCIDEPRNMKQGFVNSF